MFKQQTTPAAVNGASHADALCASSKQDWDRSLEIPIHLTSARAIADLVFTVCGSSSDGSDSLIDSLETRTLSNAMYAIMEHLDAAEEVQRDLDRARLDKVAKASAGH
jgi:hypothetical protein